MIDVNKLLREDGSIDGYLLRELLIELDSSSSENVLDDFAGGFYSISYDSAVTNENFAHGLGFKPTDIIMMSKSPDTEGVTWSYDSFTTTNVVLTTTGAVTIRCLIGAYDG